MLFTAGRRVLNNAHEVRYASTTSLSTQANTMEDILNTAKFRERKSYISEDSDLWAEALSEYDKLLRTRRKPEDGFNDKNGNDASYQYTHSQWEDYPVENSRKRQVETKDMPTESQTKGAKSRPRSGSSPAVMKVTHSDKLVRSNVGSSTPVAVCKSGGMKDIGQGQQGSSNDGAEEKKLTVFDRIMINSQMTQSIMYGNCGKPHPTGTVCFGLPSGCVEEQACRLIVNFGYDASNPGYVSVNLAGETSHDGFIAFAFSHDRFIGHDLVVYCINFRHSPKPAAALYLAFTESHHSIIQKSRKYFENNFCPRFGYHQNEMLACSFDIAAKVYLDDATHTDITKTPFYLMLAFGHYIDSVPVRSSDYGGLKYQHLVQFSSDPIVLKDALKNPKIIYPRSRILIQVHAITAVIPFIFLIPSAMFFAKYGREANGYDTDMCSRFRVPAWLRNHMFLVFFSVPFIITSLITILVELDFTWRSFKTIPMIHSITGVVAYFLFSTNFACGFFYKCERYSDYSSDKNDSNSNPEEDTGNESKAKLALIMNWTHWISGNLSYLCTVVCICISGSLPRAQTPCFVEYFGYLHFSLFLCSHIIMTFDTRRLAKILGDDRPVVKRRAIIGPMIPWRTKDISEEDSVHQFSQMDIWKGRRRVILFFFLVSFICAFTISVLMLLPVVLCR